MAGLCKDLRVWATALILGLALGIWFDPAVAVQVPETFAGADHAASSEASGLHNPCQANARGDRIGDHCSDAVHCSGSGCVALLAPAGAFSLQDAARPTWGLSPDRYLRGVDPPIDRHPPRKSG